MAGGLARQVGSKRWVAGWLLLLLAALLALAGCAAEAAQGNTAAERITAQAGQEFKIVLDSNVSTGYSWQLAQPLDDKIVQLVGSEYKEPAASGKVSAAGTEVWTFKAVAQGQTEIALKYVRPWEKDAEPAEARTFTVTVP